MPYKNIKEAYPYNAKWKRDRWNYWRSFGLCGKCGLPCGKFSMCLDHRRKHTASMNRRYRRLKNGK